MTTPVRSAPTELVERPMVLDESRGGPSQLSLLVEGNHPDPVTLRAPGFDDQGLLRWGSVPRLPG